MREVHNGKSIIFWRDSWLEDQPLVDVESSLVNEEELNQKVVDYWEIGVGWKWHNLNQKLSLSNIVKLASIVIRPDADVADKVG